jgi:hypothetical protein
MDVQDNAAAALGKLAQRLSDAQQDAQDAIDKLDATKFKVASSDETKERQQALFEALADALDKVERYRDDPLRRGIYSGELSRLYEELASTYNETVRTIVTFTDDEVAEFNKLLQGCVLDAAKRQQRAAILDSAVQLSRLALRFAAKVAAA